MMQMKYNPEISLGTIVEVVTLLLIVGGGYAALASNDVRHDTMLSAQEKEITRISKSIEDTANNIHQEIKDVSRDVKELNSTLTKALVENARNRQPH